jgi:hypothetical protein
MRRPWLWRSVILGVAGTLVKGSPVLADLRWAAAIDPLNEVLVTAAARAYVFGDGGGTAVAPPLGNALVWWAVVLGGFGIEVAVVGNLATWVWRKLRRRGA